MPNQKSLLSIKNLSVSVEDKQIVRNLNLVINSREIHALMGPNGSGKSTLAYTLMGHPHYVITSGSIMLGRKNLAVLTPDKRAQAGIFLSFQQPYEIPGVQVFTFLKSMYRAVHKKDIAVGDFYQLVHDSMQLLGIDPTYMHRNVNEGFSGGEKKRLEMLQMLVLQPKLAIFDEIDSGLDVDGIKNIISAVQTIKKLNPNMSMLFITHYQKILDFIKPDCVHVMHEGTIKISGDGGLAKRIDEKGFGETRQKEIS